MRRILLIALPLTILAAASAIVAVRRRRTNPDEPRDVQPPSGLEDLPEAIGEPIEELREVHDAVAAMPRLGPEEAEAESRTRPSGLTLYDEIIQREEVERHGAIAHLGDDPSRRAD